MNTIGPSKAKFHKRNQKRCWYCGEKVILDEKGGSGERLATIDHQVPLSRGGGNSSTNRVTACASCNHKKAAMTVEEYRKACSREQHYHVIFYGETLEPVVCIDPISGGRLREAILKVPVLNERYSNIEKVNDHDAAKARKLINTILEQTQGLNSYNVLDARELQLLRNADIALKEAATLSGPVLHQLRAIERRLVYYQHQTRHHAGEKLNKFTVSLNYAAEGV